jgi:hypothetical protein
MTLSIRLARGTIRPLLTTVGALMMLLGATGVAGADYIVTQDVPLSIIEASPTPLIFTLQEPANPADTELYDLSITGALWAPGSQGFVNLVELPGPITISDRAVFENIDGVAHLLFGSDNESGVLPPQVLDVNGLLLLRNIPEDALAIPTIPIPLDLISPSGTVVPVSVTLFSNLAEAPPGSPSDEFTIRTVPEPASMILLGLGILGVSGAAWLRRRRATSSIGRDPGPLRCSAIRPGPPGR